MEALKIMPPERIAKLRHNWTVWARADQLPPAAAQGGGLWSVWLILGGRGAGKTRAGAEWVRALATGRPPVRRIALLGETFADVRDVMVEGPSGILAVHPRSARPKWEPSRRRLAWPNGVVAHAFSAEDPESLRGPQFGAAWLDELAKWRQAREAWDMLQFGLRLGRLPQQLVTTTPRPIPLLKELLADPHAAVTRAATADNRFHLAPGFVETMARRYGGTRLGRQELLGEILEERQDALWSRDLLEACREPAAPADLVRIVVAVDPPASSSRRADSCGIVAAGIDAAGLVHVLEDATVSGARPAAWASAACAVVRRWEADALVVEVNQGGEMAQAVLAEADPGVPVTPVRATRGKHLRAEPVAHLYELGRVRHAGAFPGLEDELCDFGPTPTGFGLSSGRSPDRLDALVWAVTALALGPKGAAPRVRRV
ncbi:ATP-binding protein [Alsobacter soli]|uniref:ATP-binding protein n=2 Tax=Alsobacter soli TaxID=2109933 RepID=A0A2T1HSA8_9HYPH|nr:ATP-binding protein [Alsobacter soli]